jgi:hypothetical protein
MRREGNNVSDDPFARIKQIDADGNEFWSAQDLRNVLGYAAWHNFDDVCQEIHTSFCMENAKQSNIILSSNTKS